jgi:predicted MFS family arabinose efflux permease
MRRILATVLYARLLINAQFRIVYPFLPAISRGLGLPLETTALLVGVRSLAGITSPLYGWLADRGDRRVVMLGGLALLVAGAALVAVAPGFGVALIAFVLLGFSKAAYDPAAQAYVSDAVPYERRGRALGITELSWAGSWLIGVPLAGLLIARFGWQSPFAVIAGLSVLAIFATLRLRPVAHSESAGDTPAADSPAEDAQVGPHKRLAWLNWSTAAMLAVSVLVVTANENLFMVYGAWFEGQFGLPVATLGIVSIVISLAELAAAGASAGIVDRVGKHRALLAGLMLNALAYLLLPRIVGTLAVTMVAMAVVAMTSEFAIVSALPLVSELAPQARGTVMATNAALISVGVMIVSVLAPRLWSSGGLALTTAMSAAMAAIATVLLFSISPRRLGAPRRTASNA